MAEDVTRGGRPAGNKGGKGSDKTLWYVGGAAALAGIAYFVIKGRGAGSRKASGTAAGAGTQSYVLPGSEWFRETIIDQQGGPRRPPRQHKLHEPPPKKHRRHRRRPPKPGGPKGGTPPRRLNRGVRERPWAA